MFNLFKPQQCQLRSHDKLTIVTQYIKCYVFAFGFEFDLELHPSIAVAQT